MFTLNQDIHNPKIIFQLIFYLNKKRDLGKNYQELREIFYSNGTPISEQGKGFYNLFTAFKLLRNHLDINSIYLACQCLSINIEKCYLERFDIILSGNDFRKKISNVIRFSFENNIFGDFTGEMIALIVDVILEKNGYVPMVFEHNFLIFLKLQVKLGISSHSIIDLLSIYNDKSNKYLVRYSDNLSKEKIIDIILLNRVNLIKKGANAIWLFGSFAKGHSNEFSDVDFFVSSEAFNIATIKMFLEEKLGRSVDLQLDENNWQGDSSDSRKERILIYDERK